MGVTSDSLWALFAGTVARRLSRSTHWMRTQRYISGGMLISLGVATAFAGFQQQEVKFRYPPFLCRASSRVSVFKMY